MRILSQDKEHDVNYDLVSLRCNNQHVSGGIFAETDGLFIHLGTYNTLERAKEVMAELRRRYAVFTDGRAVYQMPEE